MSDLELAVRCQYPEAALSVDEAEGLFAARFSDGELMLGSESGTGVLTEVTRGDPHRLLAQYTLENHPHEHRVLLQVATSSY